MTQTTEQFDPRHDANWATIGFRIDREQLHTNAGDNASDKVALRKLAPIPVPVDFDLIVGYFGKDWFLGIADSASVRVKAQNRARPLVQQGKSDGEILAAIYDTLRGVRRRGVRRVADGRIRIVAVLPNGVRYEGDDETAFRQAFAAALVDLGIPGNVAIEKARNVPLPK